MTLPNPDLLITDDGRVRTIELNRPQARNALTEDVNAALMSAIGGIDDDIRAIVVTGRGGAFCAGVDLRAALEAGPRSADAMRHTIRTSFHGVIRALVESPVPTIAAVDGPAVGFGCDLALACDIRLGSASARFGEVFVRRGLMSDGGGSFLLSRIVGLGRALELMYTGDTVESALAERYGLLNHVYAAAEFRDQVTAFAQRLAAGPPIAYREVKRAVYASLSGDLDAALTREVEGQVRCLASQDFQEGVAAFLQKRPAKFEGR